MADMTITGDAKFGSVVTEMQKVEKASDSMKRKMEAAHRSMRANMGAAYGTGTPARSGYQKSGMGLLEVSRGVEDFAVAGMRGLMNNIPGMIMSFGGGMGLAAVVSLAAVALTVFGKELLSIVNPTSIATDQIERLKAASESLSSSINKMRDSKAAKEIAADIAMLGKEAENWINKTLAFNEDPTRSFGINEQEIALARRGADEIQSLTDKLKELQTGKKQMGVLDLGVKRIEEDIPRLEKLVADLKERGPNLGEILEADKSDPAGIDSITNKLALAESAVAGYQAQIKDLEGQLGGFGNKVKAYAIDFAALYLSGKGSSAASEMAATRKQMGFELPEIEIGNKLGIAKGELWVVEKKKKSLEAILKLEEAALANGVTVKDQYEMEMRANQASLESAEAKLKAAKALLAIERDKLALMEQIQKAELAGSFAEIETKLTGMGLNGSSMLSSSGRIGGSVKEYNSAIATINYQRETLSVLRRIAQNTARKNQSTYN